MAKALRRHSPMPEFRRALLIRRWSQSSSSTISVHRNFSGHRDCSIGALHPASNLNELHNFKEGDDMNLKLRLLKFVPVTLAACAVLIAAGCKNHYGEDGKPAEDKITAGTNRSEEHTSELQSLRHLVCRLLLEKKKH